MVAGRDGGTAATGGGERCEGGRRRGAAGGSGEGPLVTAPGSFTSELGCPGDWAPECMRTWLQDPDGDGVFTVAEQRAAFGANYDLFNGSWRFRESNRLLRLGLEFVF